MVLPIGFNVARVSLGSSASSWALSYDSSQAEGLHLKRNRSSLAYDPLTKAILVGFKGSTTPSGSSGDISHFVEFSAEGDVNWSKYLSFTGTNWLFYGSTQIVAGSNGKWMIFNTYEHGCVQLDIGTGNNFTRNILGLGEGFYQAGAGSNQTLTSRANHLGGIITERDSTPYFIGIWEYDLDRGSGTKQSYSISGRNVLTTAARDGAVLYNSTDGRWDHFLLGYGPSGSTTDRWTIKVQENNASNRIATTVLSSIFNFYTTWGGYILARPMLGFADQKAYARRSADTGVIFDLNSTDILELEYPQQFDRHSIQYNSQTGHYYLFGTSDNGPNVIVKWTSNWVFVGGYTITGGGSTDPINDIAEGNVTADGVVIVLRRGAYNSASGAYIIHIADSDFDNLAGTYGTGNDAITFSTIFTFNTFRTNLNYSETSYAMSAETFSSNSSGPQVYADVATTFTASDGVKVDI